MSAALGSAPPQAVSPARRRAGLLLRLGIAAGLLGWLLASGAIEPARLARLLEAPARLSAALLVLVLASGVVAMRLPVLLAPLGMRLTARAALRLTFIGLFFNLFLPGGAGGDAAKIYYAIDGQAGRRAELATVILLDRAVALLALLLFPLCVLPLGAAAWTSAPELRALVGAAVGIGALGVAALAALVALPQGPARRLSGVLARLPLGALATRVLAALRCYRARPLALLRAFAMSLVAHAGGVAVVVVLAPLLLGAAPWADVAVVAPLGFVANALPITPGGLGVGEAAFDRLFAAVGLDGGGEVMLAWRVLLVGLSALGGLVYVASRRGGFVDAPPPAAAQEERT